LSTGYPQIEPAGLRHPAPVRTLERVDKQDSQMDLPGALRALRRRADLSQRELAARSGVPSATVGSVESGASANPTFQTVERLVAATGARLAIIDLDGTEPARLRTDGFRDEAGRRLPPHLDPHWVSWRGARRLDRFGFVRNRHRRDVLRRDRAGERRQDLGYDVRQLGPGDAAVLAALRTGAPELDLAGRAAPAGPGLPDEAALRYLRDPNLRHWIAEERGIAKEWIRGRVLGHLVAHIHHRYAGPPVMVVTEIGVRPEHRQGLVGIRLVAAMSDEAARGELGEIVALITEPAAASYLRGLGFRRRPRRPPLLTLVG
jgi:transcriptional regulator with XRE-family HTH domain